MPKLKFTINLNLAYVWVVFKGTLQPQSKFYLDERSMWPYFRTDINFLQIFLVWGKFDFVCRVSLSTVGRHFCLIAGESGRNNLFDCSEHVTPDSFEENLSGLVPGYQIKGKLKANSVPSIFPQRSTGNRRSTGQRRNLVRARRAVLFLSCQINAY